MLECVRCFLLLALVGIVPCGAAVDLSAKLAAFEEFVATSEPYAAPVATMVEHHVHIYTHGSEPDRVLQVLQRRLETGEPQERIACLVLLHMAYHEQVAGADLGIDSGLLRRSLVDLTTVELERHWRAWVRALIHFYTIDGLELPSAGPPLQAAAIAPDGGFLGHIRYSGDLFSLDIEAGLGTGPDGRPPIIREGCAEGDVGAPDVVPGGTGMPAD